MATRPREEIRLFDIGDVECACGLTYRYARTEEGATLWPQSSSFGFSRTPLADDTCIRCSAPVTVERPSARPAAA